MSNEALLHNKSYKDDMSITKERQSTQQQQLKGGNEGGGGGTPLQKHSSINNIPSPSSPLSTLPIHPNNKQDQEQSSSSFSCCDVLCCLGTGCILAELCFPEKSPFCKVLCYPFCCCFLPYFLFPEQAPTTNTNHKKKNNNRHVK
jgi:hypothetical protein